MPTTTTTNLPLYRVLVKLGAPETEAAAATQLDDTLATKSDLQELRLALRAELKELEARLTTVLLTTLIAMTAIFSGISAALRWLR